MPQEWWVRRGNHEQGPFSPQEIKSLVSTGKLTPVDLVRTTTKPEWREARTVQGLFGKRVVTPPPLPQLGNNSSPQIQSSSPTPQRSKSLFQWISSVSFVVLAVLYIAAKVNHFSHKIVSGKAKATEKQNVGIAEQKGGGQKLAAFKKLVAQYKKMPGDYASTDERVRFNRNLHQFQSEFEQIEFDAKANRKEAQTIIELYRKEIENRYQGEEPRCLEIEISGMYLELRE